MSAFCGFVLWEQNNSYDVSLEEMLIPVKNLGDDNIMTYKTQAIGMGLVEWNPDFLYVNRPTYLTIGSMELVVMIEGRIYDYPDLGDSLLLSQNGLSPQILAVANLYLSNGLDFAKDLVGEYCIAIWDKNRRKLILASNPMGVRRMFYRKIKGGFAFATRVQQILHLTPKITKVNLYRVGEFLSPEVMYYDVHQDHTMSYFDGLQQVPPGTTIAISQDNVETREFFSIDPNCQIRYKNQRDYVEHFKDLFDQAVRDRIDPGQSVLCNLSGGLDSGSIAATVEALRRSGRACPSRFMTSSTVYKVLSCDESTYIDQIRGVLGNDVEETRVYGDNITGPLGLEGNFGIPFPESPELFLEPVAYWSRLHDASEKGYRIALHGEGGDQVCGGSSLVFDSLIKSKLYFELLRRLGVIATRHTPLAFYRGLKRLVINPFLVDASEHFHKFYSSETEITPASWFCTAYLEFAKKNYSQKNNRSLKFNLWGLEEDYRWMFPPVEVPQIFDFPMEIRVPFFDERLVKYMLAIPPEVKYRHFLGAPGYYAGSKTLLRQAMKDRLPDSFRNRKHKASYSDSGLVNFCRLADEYRKRLGTCNSRLVKLGIIDHSKCREEFDLLRSASKPGKEFSSSQWGDAKTLMTQLAIDLWLENVENYGVNEISKIPWRYAHSLKKSDPSQFVVNG